ncbi:alpha/beta fold hydrolase [Bosea sp. (in: a-proteobacteria)]|uniref:alpha/beta fold hydrolase n=1 Tax=Bosea sp. (in: a-proteobacteria) TaxID=1871050 RepID=UPI00261A9AFD|nr:alpha/beta fold hydrolase [Bosea sp. (in: a-proteobacteria)]MCO5092104.1 alpha/beta fold hydrolase [Bosea sp. (in: a-proteobacteria)]
MRLAASVLGAFLGLASLAASASAMELKGTTVILIHGKAGGQGPLQPLAAALKAEGANVVLPLMSWRSGYRTYEQTLGEVQAAVQRARAADAARVVLMGHSLGANISMGYAARSGGVAAVVALAPGHRPAFIVSLTQDSLDRAKAMVAAGRGGEKASFLDFNQGRVFPVTTTAEAYVSFFDPSGPAASAAQGNGVGGPLLWVIGTGDKPAMNDRAPYSRGTRIQVSAGHPDTPRVAVRQVIDWLRAQ